MDRRAFLTNLAVTVSGASLTHKVGLAAIDNPTGLFVGEGILDTTPPIGIELAGFHKQPGQERLIEGIRHPTAVRALYLRHGQTETAILSIDVVGLSDEVAKRVQTEIEVRTGIPASHVRLCATHTHSMPTFRYCRQWGAIPEDYLKEVESKLVQAAALAKEDAVASEVFIGKATAIGANFNRTVKEWKNEDAFDESANDSERWLDRLVQTLRFERSGGKKPLLWYHFSAHPVCYTDGLAGPDWVGIVTDTIQQEMGITPSFLQGHAGDVNPGNGEPWLGVPEDTAARVCDAIRSADKSSQRIAIDDFRILSEEVEIPLNIALFRDQIERYRRDPSLCQEGEWVDAGFAKDWFEGASKWDLERTTLSIPMTAIRMGEAGLLFHPSELYSYYGLVLRHKSPFPHTVAVGYTDGLIGYLTDPKAYETGEYAATTVPKILDLPPFAENAAETLVSEAVGMLERVS